MINYRIMKHIKDEPSLQVSIDPGIVYISTNPDQSSYANLTVSIENTGTNVLSISSVAITLPQALAPASGLNSIVPVADQPELWIFAPSEINTGEFDAIPVSGQNVDMTLNETWSFEMQMVTLTNVASPSPADVTLAITFADGSTSNVLLNVNIDVAVASIVSFVSDRANINSGESATLSWNCDKIDYCIISPVGADPLQPTDTIQVAPQSTTAYTLFAYGDGIILSTQRTVSVDNPQIIYFVGLNGQTGVNYGDNITLVWECNQFTENITLVADDKSITIPPLLENGNTPQKGSITAGLIIQPVTFAFNAYGNSQENPDQRNTLIMINDLSYKFTADPNTGIWEGDNVTLEWDIQSASAVSISPPLTNGPSLQNLSGSIIINPTSDIEYVVTVSGFISDAPVTQPFTLSLQVQQVLINSFTATPNPVIPGNDPNQVTIAWDVQAQTFSIDNDIDTPNATGSVVVNASVNNSIYTLKAGTNLSPGMQSNLVTIINAYGPYTFNTFQNNYYEPSNVYFTVSDPAALSTIPINPISQTTFQVTLTGLTPIGTPPPGYLAEIIYDSLQTPQGFMVFSSDLVDEPPIGFNWADPNNPTGTITIIE